MRLVGNIDNPLVLPPLTLTELPFLTDDLTATAVIVAMEVLGGVLCFLQEKRAIPYPAEANNPLGLPNVCMLGSNMESGSVTSVAVHTGDTDLL